MPKYNIRTNKTVNIFFIILVIATAFCFLGCGNVHENITNPTNPINPINKDKDTSNKDKDTSKIKDKDTSKIKDKSKENVKNKENFLDWSMYNPPIVNGYTPEWFNRMTDAQPNINEYSSMYNPPAMYNPLRYSNRSQAFYDQGFYPNMSLPPQVIGCGGRNGPCLGGTQETIQVVNTPIEISERNIAPVNIIARANDPSAVGIPFQVGVLYKIFGSLNEIFPLYGIRRYRNSDTWDYTTKVGTQGNFVFLKVLTKRVNNNELQTNDTVNVDGNSGKFRVSMYDNSFPEYNPYYK
jgi:hypothetical protein